MEIDLQVYLSSCVQLYSLAETPQFPPSPRIWAHIRGRYWSAKLDDISGKTQYSSLGATRLNMYSTYTVPMLV
jgi:hypothetical protein